MRRVLIISPHFPPVNAPDMQRVRLALPYLREFGWEPIVAAVAPGSVEGAVLDPLLEQTYPADVAVFRTGGLPAAATRRFGIGSLWFRCGRQLRRSAERILAAGGVDLVFLSTTQFGAFPLGPRWRKRFGVPYVLDLQDPWVNDYYERTGNRPPGGKIKYALSQWHARRHEPSVLRDAAGIVAVSADYGRMLAVRYPGFEARRVTVLPFGASDRDFAVARDHRPVPNLVPVGDGCQHFVYAGRVTEGMNRALLILLGALLRLRTREPQTARRIRLHFIGTNYAAPPQARPMVLPLARQAGVEEAVTEHVGRVPYFDALHYLARADGLLAIGSDDPGYSASKIAPCLLAGPPLLAIFHRDSPVHGIVRDQPGVVAVPFANGDNDEDAMATITADWFGKLDLLRASRSRAQAPATLTARHMSGVLADVFNQAVT